MQIGILEPQNFSHEALDLLRSLGGVSEFEGESLDNFLAPLNALFVRLNFPINETILNKSPDLKWLCSPTTGHNHIDEDLLKKRDIKLLSLRGEREFLETIRATPEHTFGLLISLLRKYPKAFAETLAGKWDRDSCRGEELYGKKVGIIGMGRIGYRVATYCSSFGASINWIDPAEVITNEGWIRHFNISSLIHSSQIIIMCASYHREQKPILGSKEIEFLRDHYLVNTARGELIDEIALMLAVEKNVLRGVALDVITNEGGDHRLEDWRRLAIGRNVILTPHLGGATHESMEKTEVFIANKLKIALSKRVQDEAG